MLQYIFRNESFGCHNSSADLTKPNAVSPARTMKDKPFHFTVSDRIPF